MLGCVKLRKFIFGGMLEIKLRICGGPYIKREGIPLAVPGEIKYVTGLGTSCQEGVGFIEIYN